MGRHHHFVTMAVFARLLLPQVIWPMICSKTSLLHCLHLCTPDYPSDCGALAALKIGITDNQGWVPIWCPVHIRLVLVQHHHRILNCIKVEVSSFFHKERSRFFKSIAIEGDHDCQPMASVFLPGSRTMLQPGHAQDLDSDRTSVLRNSTTQHWNAVTAICTQYAA